MAASAKVRYLKIDRGRYFYQRRVPNDLQDLLDLKSWLRPCGDVTYAKAVQMVVTWAEEHDDFIKAMKSSQARQVFAAKSQASYKLAMEKSFGKTLYPDLPADEQAGGVHPSLYWIRSEIQDLKVFEDETRPLGYEVNQLRAKIENACNDATAFEQISLPPYAEYKIIKDSCQNTSIKDKILLDAPFPLSRKDNYLSELIGVYNKFFGNDEIDRPTDIDQKEEFGFLKKQLERKISELQPNPHTITALAEKYFSFNNIKEATRSKYRRDIGRLIAITGDIPITHIETYHLKQLRDQSASAMQPASLHAVFTPIKGLLRYASQEEIINLNPMSAVVLPKEKRPLEERKWKKFDPREMQRIDRAIDVIWSQEVAGVSDARRIALIMVVRTLMFTGMRPIEVLRLTPSAVDDKMIRITGSKTESSTRVIPLHPELVALPSWIASGGLETFETIKTDRTASVRHNFARLIRQMMPEPISDKQKTLYSLRTTFVNAMRRAGADIQMQRAILGHKEAGAIRHYDDGPEFKRKLEAVYRTDPRREDD